MMKWLKAFSLNIRAFVKATNYLFRPGYRRYLALPVLVYLLLLVGFVYLTIVKAEQWLNALLALFGYELAEVEAWGFALMILLQIVFIFFLGSIFKYATLIVLAPFLSFLSEKIELEATGEESEFSLGQFIHDLIRAIRINLWNFLREIGLTILLTVLGFIPLFAFLVPFMILLVQSYFYGYGLMDYNPERWRMGFQETEHWMRRNKASVLLLGLSFHLLFLIPFLGWIFAPTWSVIAGTKVAMETKEL